MGKGWFLETIFMAKDLKLTVWMAYLQEGQ